MITYIGGKSFLASWVISHFPKDYQEKTYVEVFGGGGWVLFKKEPSFLEIYNDLNKNIVNLFRVIRDKFPEFTHKAEWSLHSREMFQEAVSKGKDDKFIDEIESAINYSIRRVQSFSGSGSTWGYQIQALKKASGKWAPFLKRLPLINARLKKVQIECLDFEKLIKKYDSENTFFYLDPPYIDAEHYYNVNGVNFTHEDHFRLAKILRKIKGKFVLSYYDNPLVYELYPGCRIEKKSSVKHSEVMTRNVKNKKKQKVTELLVLNY